MNLAPTRTAALISVCLAAATALAQDDEVPAGPDRYEVELIVFRHLDQSRNTPEIPAAGSLIPESPLTLIPAEDSTSSLLNSLEFDVTRNPDSAPRADYEAISGNGNGPETGRTETPISFYLMDPRAEFPDFVPIGGEAMILGNMYDRLDTLDAYQPLMHLGWIQPAKEAADAAPYRMVSSALKSRRRDYDSRGYNPGGRDSRKADQVSGTITLYKERYLHLELELSLEENPTNSEYFTREIIADMRSTGRMVHKLQESRRIRQLNLHYFDHPLFGVIARVEKISAPEPDEG